MCGLCGFVGRGDREDLLRMSAAIAHRGPDGDGAWEDKKFNIKLAHRRLSILDLEAGHQPMSDVSGRYVIVFNGEIYNHLEIREELIKEGVSFQTDHSDTETLLQAYIHWREDMLDRLNGMFAFVVVDLNKKRLFFARDRFGKKPLFYHLDSSGIVFSSELSSLVSHSGVPTRISQISLAKYFAHSYIPSPLSLYQDVYKLESGSYAYYDLTSKKFDIRRYWQYEIKPDPVVAKMSKADVADHLAYLIDQAVRRRLYADVDIGVFLSGGLDSSLVTHFASKHKKNINTFSIGFDEKSFDETDYAKQVAMYFDSSHIHENYTINHMIHDAPKVIAMLDEPNGDPSILPTCLVSNVASHHNKVILGGDGADELFAGYSPFKALNMASHYTRMMPDALHRIFCRMMKLLPVNHSYMSFDYKINRTLRGVSYPEELWLNMWMSPLDVEEINILCGTHMAIEEIFSESIESWKRYRESDLVERAVSYFVEMYLKNDILFKIDRAGMANSLEVRAPFLDRDLVDFSEKIPSSYRLDGGTTKAILRDIAKNRLPEQIISRKKQGFGVPTAKWFYNQSISFTHAIADLNQDFVSSKYNSHLAKKENNKDFLWSYYVLERYLENQL